MSRLNSHATYLKGFASQVSRRPRSGGDAGREVEISERKQMETLVLKKPWTQMKNALDRPPERRAAEEGFTALKTGQEK